MFTGMAQWERAGLITPRSLVRVQLPVFFFREFVNHHALDRRVQEGTMSSYFSSLISQFVTHFLISYIRTFFPPNGETDFRGNRSAGVT